MVVELELPNRSHSCISTRVVCCELNKGALQGSWTFGSQPLARQTGNTTGRPWEECHLFDALVEHLLEDTVPTLTSQSWACHWATALA